ncbi:Dynein light chain LC6 [Nymphaea thermarum]|nr:Dynein light chain LC6 [Nymphaea thermarum]
METQAPTRADRIRKAGRRLASMTKVVVEGRKAEPPEKPKRQSAVLRSLVPASERALAAKLSQEEDQTVVEMDQRRKSASEVEWIVGSRVLAGNLGQQEDLTGVEMDPRRKSVSEVEMHAGSVAAFANAKVRAVDMPAFMQAHAFRCARRAYDSLEKFSAKHMAFAIKKEFDTIYGPAWHCIVGSSFGSFVTHSRGCFIYFSIEQVFILLFKTRVVRATN